MMNKLLWGLIQDQTPDWYKFLQRFSNSDGLLTFIHGIVTNPQKRMKPLIIQGPQASGKSTFIEALALLLGPQLSYYQNHKLWNAEVEQATVLFRDDSDDTLSQDEVERLLLPAFIGARRMQPSDASIPNNLNLIFLTGDTRQQQVIGGLQPTVVEAPALLELKSKPIMLWSLNRESRLLLTILRNW